MFALEGSINVQKLLVQRNYLWEEVCVGEKFVGGQDFSTKLEFGVDEEVLEERNFTLFR
jgi:hypothetical protein